MLRPIEPLQPDLSSKFLMQKFKFADAGNVLHKHDFAIDAARDVRGLAPYLGCWGEHRQRGRLPSLRDFDGLRETVEISGVHLVETPTADFGDFRFSSFDATTRVDGHDFSGTYVADYPDSSFREAARLDYTAAATTGEGRLTVLNLHRVERSGKFARLVLPLSESNSTTPSGLLVVVQLLEHCPVNADDVGQIWSDSRTGSNSDSVWAEGTEFPIPGPVAADKITVAGTLAAAVGSEELVNRYFQDGIHEHLGDPELLHWLLHQSLGSDRASNLAVMLIEEFGSLPAVLAMGRERLFEFPGLTHQALLSLKVVRELATRLVRSEAINRPVVSGAREVIDYCRARMAHETIEHLRVLYIDQKNRLITDEVFGGGGVSSVSVNPRQILKRAILVDAQSFIMAHNHPSGDPSPSAADVEVTRDVKRAAEAVEIRLLDHLIIGRSGSVSLRALGYFDDH